MRTAKHTINSSSSLKGSSSRQYFLQLLAQNHCNFKSIAYLLIQTVGQDPLLLLGVEEQALDVEVQTVLLIGSPFIRADEDAALNLWITKKHDLNRKMERKC